MDELEKKELYNTLYDYYKNLLTDKQKEYYEGYYFLDLSLSEMAENYNVSRNAIYDTLKKTTKLLESYEDKLGLRKKEDALYSILDSYKDSSNKEIKDIIEKIKNME